MAVGLPAGRLAQPGPAGEPDPGRSRLPRTGRTADGMHALDLVGSTMDPYAAHVGQSQEHGRSSWCTRYAGLQQDPKPQATAHEWRFRHPPSPQTSSLLLSALIVDGGEVGADLVGLRHAAVGVEG